MVLLPWLSLTHSCCVGSPCSAVFLQETFERAKAWVKELQRQASPNIVIALSGNKADLAEKRLVEYEVTLIKYSYPGLEV